MTSPYREAPQAEDDGQSHRRAGSIELVSTPYRSAPDVLVCPRCGEFLDMVFEGVAACPRCQGAWLPRATLVSSFADPRWPPGQSMWWHDELECPGCAAEGTLAKLAARNAEGVMVDACATHGVWLDPGEVARLMGLAPGSDELLALQKRVSKGPPDPARIARRRRAWRAEMDARTKEETELRQRAMAEQRQLAVEAAERAKETGAREEAERLRRVAIARASESRAQEKLLARIDTLGSERAKLVTEIDELERTIPQLESEVVQCREQLATVKVTLATVVADLAAAQTLSNAVK